MTHRLGWRRYLMRIGSSLLALVLVAVGSTFYQFINGAGAHPRDGAADDGWRSFGGALAAQSAQSAPAATKPVPAELPAVVARVDSESITRDELENAVRASERRAGSTVPPEQRDEVFRALLEQLIGYRVLGLEARQRAIAVPDSDLNARLAELRQRFPTEEAFTLQGHREVETAAFVVSLKAKHKIEILI
jgi:hypothetical protein